MRIVLALEHSKASSLSLSDSGHVRRCVMSLRMLNPARDILVLLSETRPRPSRFRSCLAYMRRCWIRMARREEQGRGDGGGTIVPSHMADIYENLGERERSGLCASAQRKPGESWKHPRLDPEGDIESLVYLSTDVEESKIRLMVQGEPQGWKVNERGGAGGLDWVTRRAGKDSRRKSSDGWDGLSFTLDPGSSRLPHLGCIGQLRCGADSLA